MKKKTLAPPPAIRQQRKEKNAMKKKTLAPPPAIRQRAE